MISDEWEGAKSERGGFAYEPIRISVLRKALKCRKIKLCFLALKREKGVKGQVARFRK